jgi:dihydrofolate reductase
MGSSVRVFIASSLDGFIAGPGGDLSWLPDPPEGSDEDYGWGAFIEDIGCLLMGRGTYDAVEAMGVPWPHPDRPTVIATTRPLRAPPPNVEAARGTIGELVAVARERAGGRDVYIDGGDLIRQALDAGLVAEAIVTLCPVVLGAGHPLFAGARRRHALELKGARELPGGLVQLTYTTAG